MSRWRSISGALSVAMLLAYATVSIWEQIAGAAVFYLKEQHASASRSTEILSDGRVILRVDTHGQFTESKYLDLENRPVAAPADDEVPNYNWSSVSALDSLANGGLRSFRDLHLREGFWYLIESGQGRGYFVGYDSISNARIGYLGTKGLQSTIPELKDQFSFVDRMIGSRSVEGPWVDHGNNAIYPNWRGFSDNEEIRIPMVFINSGTEVYLVDLARRDVRVLLEHPQIASVDIVETEAWDETSKYLAARTPDNLILINVAAGSTTSLPIPEELRSIPFHWYRIKTGGYIFSVTDWYHTRMWWLDAAGKVTSTREFSDRVSTYRRSAIEEAILWPLPISLCWEMVLSAPREIAREREISLAEARSLSVTEFRIPLAIVTLLSAILSGLAIRKQRRFHESTTSAVIWALFVLFGGPPAYVGYLCHRTWPPKVVTMGADYLQPQPVLKGTEIFA